MHKNNSLSRSATILLTVTLFVITEVTLLLLLLGILDPFCEQRMTRGLTGLAVSPTEAD